MPASVVALAFLFSATADRRSSGVGVSNAMDEMLTTREVTELIGRGGAFGGFAKPASADTSRAQSGPVITHTGGSRGRL